MTARDWVFTLNNPEIDEIQWDEKKVQYAVWQKEVGEQGTPHLQGFVVLKRDQRLSYVRKVLPTGHWEKRKGTREQAAAYCEKSDTRVAGPWYFGKLKRKGERTDIHEAMALVRAGVEERKIAEELPGTWVMHHRAFERYRRLCQVKRTWKTEVIVRWGGTGTGKTRWVFDNEPDVHPMEYQNQFWSAYDGEEVVLWDDFQPGMISRDLFLRLTDRYPCRLRILHGWAQWTPKKLYITSNYDPATWYGGDPAVLRRLDQVIHLE